MSDVNLDAPVKLAKRQIAGKGLQTLRQEGLVPAVIHNHGKDSVLVMGKELELHDIYRHAGKHHPLNLEVGDQKFLALIKDVHFHPAKRRLQHLVFQAIRQDEAVEAEVPIRLDGEIPAEKAGFTIFHQLDSLEVEALPKDLPDELVVDASVLAELGDKITVADIKLPAGVKLKDEEQLEHPIATVMETKAMISEEELAAEAEAAAAQAAEAAAEGEEAAEPAEGETGVEAPAETSQPVSNPEK